MKKQKVQKKFIAVLVSYIEKDKDETGSRFYISDVDYYNENFGIPDNITYSDEIYSAIENLGKGCSCNYENGFDTSEKLGGEAGLRKFLKPLPWIMVFPESKFEECIEADPSKISQSIETYVHDADEDEDDYEDEDDDEDDDEFYNE